MRFKGPKYLRLVGFEMSYSIGCKFTPSKLGAVYPIEIVMKQLCAQEV